MGCEHFHERHLPQCMDLLSSRELDDSDACSHYAALDQCVRWIRRMHAGGCADGCVRQICNRKVSLRTRTHLTSADSSEACGPLRVFKNAGVSHDTVREPLSPLERVVLPVAGAEIYITLISVYVHPVQALICKLPVRQLAGATGNTCTYRA